MARILLVLVLSSGCAEVTLADRPCGPEGECLAGWDCHPETGFCVPETVVGCDGLGLCPSEVQAGDPCPDDGAFIPCVDGVEDCSEGCRTCEDGIWSDTCTPCVPDGFEVCDGRDNDCNGDVDDMTQVEIDLDCDEPLAHAASWSCDAGVCRIAECDDGFWNVETSNDDCEYPCALTFGGTETCDALDNDCNGAVDDIFDLEADCRGQLGEPPEVLEFVCDPDDCSVVGCCNIERCNPGYSDADGAPSTGCEEVCAPQTPGPEICDKEDNDCDGKIDNPGEPGASGCVTFFRDHDQDGHGAYGLSECWCVETGEYTAVDEDDCDDDDATSYEGALELCDGRDNDCDPTTDDGIDEPNLGDPCDGDDAGLCEEGIWSCDAVSLYCSDVTGDDVEGPVGDPTCDDNDDNDCDELEDLDDPNCCGWPYRKTITIHADRVAGSGGVHEDFPLLVSLVDADLDDRVVSAAGDDLRFRSFDATTCATTTPPCELDYELEDWDDTDGTLVAWVRLPALSQDEDTVIYLHYGNPCAAPGENPDGVWTAEYAGVWHMTGLSDSTPNSNDGGDHGTDPSGGLIAQSRYFDGSDERVTVNDDDSLDITRNLTMSAWIHTGSPSSNMKVFGKTDPAEPSRGYVIAIFGGLYPEVWNSAGANHSFNSGTISANTWTHVAITWETGGSLIGYIDGVEVNRIDAGENEIGTSSEPLDIGCPPWDHDTYEFGGNIDEVRLVSEARDANWLLTSVRNQRWPDRANFPTEGFYTVGAEEPGI